MRGPKRVTAMSGSLSRAVLNGAFVVILAATASKGIATRQHFLDMAARAYYPGRTAQLMIIAREGDFVTRTDRDYLFMHGSPWPYDVSIPMLFVGPMVKAGNYSEQAVQQDVAPTIAAALGVRMPPTASGHVLPVLRAGSPRPRAVMLVVLDGMRRDYFDRYASSLPTLTALRRSGAWFSQASVNVIPSNTAVGHSTIATGADPAVHGITGTNVYDFVHRRRHDFFAEKSPQDLMAPTLSDVWQLATGGRAVILAQGSIDRAATPLAGHGACLMNGSRVSLASYDQRTGAWATDTSCFQLPEVLTGRNARSLWQKGREWMGHRIDSTTTVRHSGLFPAFEADAMIATIEHEALGQDSIPDLVLLNFKCADFVGHSYVPESEELRTTLAEMDHQLARILAALESKVGKNYLLAVTADHGMPPTPASPDRRHFAPQVVDLIHQKFDPQEKRLVMSYDSENSQIFVDETRLSALGFTLKDVARFLESQPYVFAVFTEPEIRAAAHHAAPRGRSEP